MLSAALLITDLLYTYKLRAHPLRLHNFFSLSISAEEAAGDLLAPKQKCRIEHVLREGALRPGGHASAGHALRAVAVGRDWRSQPQHTARFRFERAPSRVPERQHDFFRDAAQLGAQLLSRRSNPGAPQAQFLSGRVPGALHCLQEGACRSPLRYCCYISSDSVEPDRRLRDFRQQVNRRRARLHSRRSLQLVHQFNPHSRFETVSTPIL